MHLTRAALGCLSLGVLFTAPDLTLLGGALLLGLFSSRAMSQVSLGRARASGFEMLWRVEAKNISSKRLENLELWAELQNRDSAPTDFRELNVLHARGLRVVVTPTAGTVPPHASLLVRLQVVPLRVGVHGIFGLSLETIRAPGLYQAPLVFPNSLTIQVLPRTHAEGQTKGRSGVWFGRLERLGRGTATPSGDFRELREHRSGDPYHRIAWKASARRGKLLVVENEVRDQVTAWVLLDMSQDFWAGELGEAPLDHAVDRVATLLTELSARGQRVGLIVFGRRRLFRSELGRGPGHVSRMIAGLSLHCHCLDADRSGYSLAEVQARVAEHARFSSGSFARFAEPREFLSLVDELRRKAPFPAPRPFARSQDEASLRRYLWAYGIDAPPSSESEQALSEMTLSGLLPELAAARPRPHHVHIFAAAPGAEAPPTYYRALERARGLGVGVHFHPFARGQNAGSSKEGEVAQARLASLAVSVSREVSERKALAELRRVGIDVVGSPGLRLGNDEGRSLDQRTARE